MKKNLIYFSMICLCVVITFTIIRTAKSEANDHDRKSPSISIKHEHEQAPQSSAQIPDDVVYKFAFDFLARNKDTNPKMVASYLSRFGFHSEDMTTLGEIAKTFQTQIDAINQESRQLEESLKTKRNKQEIIQRSTQLNKSYNSILNNSIKNVSTALSQDGQASVQLMLAHIKQNTVLGF